MAEELTVTPIKHPKKVFSRIGLSLFLYFVAVYASSFIFGAAASFFAPSFYQSEAFMWINMVLCQYIIGIPVIRLTLIGLPTYKYKKEKMSFGKLFITFAICQGLSYVGNIIGLALNQGISGALGKEIENNVEEIIKNSNILILFLVIGIIGPVMEELVFRKFIIDRIRPYGEVLAVLFSGIAFGMFHGNFYQFFYAAAIGIILGFIYIRTKNIMHTIILHCAFNCLSVLGQGLTNASESTALPEVLRAVFTGLYYLLTLSLLALVIFGIVTFIKSVKKVFFIKNVYDIPKNKVFLYSCVNVGVILFTVAVLVEFVISIFL